MSVTLNISETSRVDHVWDFSISDAEPGQQMTICADFIDLFGNTWRSHATFIANQKGMINLKDDAPIAGSYSGIDPMGLIWSMQCESVHGLLARRSDLSPIEIKIQVKNKENNIFAEKKVKRYLIEPDVKITSIRQNGLVGTLYQPANPKFEQRPALIVLSGSEGGFRHEQAALLASEGYVAFALAYFIFDQNNYTDLPDNFPSRIYDIPLEYFEKAILFLEQQADVDPDKIGVIGTSRGGELALLLGSKFSQLKCIIAYVPNHAVQAAFGPSDHSVDETAPSWTYQGKDIPCFPLKVNHVDWFGNKPVVLKEGFLMTFSEEALIPVEKINGPILLISAGDDQMWSSHAMSELVMKRLDEKGHKYLADSQHITFEKAGHLIMIPWWPSTGYHAVHPVDQVDYDFGGTSQADAHAGNQSWLIIKDFLSKQFS